MDWSSQDLVDTLPPSSRGFKVLGTDATEVTVAPSRIVERFDVFGNIGVCNLAIPVDFLLDPFFLQATEE
jgi:hypothetical protein